MGVNHRVGTHPPTHGHVLHRRQRHETGLAQDGGPIRTRRTGLAGRLGRGHRFIEPHRSGRRGRMTIVIMVVTSVIVIIPSMHDRYTYN